MSLVQEEVYVYAYDRLSSMKHLAAPAIQEEPLAVGCVVTQPSLPAAYASKVSSLCVSGG